MGLLCCKTQETEPNRQGIESELAKNLAEGRNQEVHFDTITDKSEKELNDDVSGDKEQTTEFQTGRISKKIHINDAQEAEIQINGKTNNLELYLNDVFEKECVIKATHEEVEFIQRGIETLSQTIVDLTLKEYQSTVCDGDEQMEEQLEKVYDFPLKTRRTGIIIKVGSFYEGTKNNFPDEFDLIFPLFCTGEKPFPPPVCHFYEKLDERLIQTVTTNNKKSLVYVSSTDTQNVTRKLYFDKYVRQHGPAFMLQFIYNNGSGQERYIHVDLVPAVKVMKNTLDIFVRYVNMQVKPRSFFNEVFSAENHLDVNGRISFTETEVHFMRNILSKKHVKVYRILKFLINGHGDGEIMDLYHLTSNYMSVPHKGYSSYQIKTMMIYHHDTCTNAETEKIGPCVIQILEEMCICTNFYYFPTILEPKQNNSDVLLPVPYLKSLVEILKLVQATQDNYDYERIKMKSVSRKYLDGLDRNEPDNALWFRYLDTLGAVDPSYDSLMKYFDALRVEDLDDDNYYCLD